ncbi:DUF397 domain-containing protein [Nocardiopsis baichengensis]|uniref:DUF397 domain-containing protein n=1 Tax=Nocardiopsis baichengensis TaxID=280240 RepID=UPI0009FCD5E6|nr:DUF397 domain-containing protein [Nocardiopsis baichengensis]
MATWPGSWTISEGDEVHTYFTPEWHKSSYSSPEGQECVEVTGPWRPSDQPTELVRVRDSKAPSATILCFPKHAWIAFTEFLK